MIVFIGTQPWQFLCHALLLLVLSFCRPVPTARTGGPDVFGWRGIRYTRLIQGGHLPVTQSGTLTCSVAAVTLIALGGNSYTFSGSGVVATSGSS